MTIRKGNIDDLNELQQLFTDTVKFVCKADYDDKQIEVWTASIENKERWNDIITNQMVIVAQHKNKITGFCTLYKGNYIDLLYVHKEFQRQGIANKLYTYIEKAAKQQAQNKLTADVSKTAKPFFQKMGFTVLAEQKVIIRGIELINYKMIKEI